MTDNRHPNDDLRVIRGLGPKCASALPMLGIGNCAELAQYLTQHSAQELSDRLAELDVKVAAGKIEKEDWLGNARKQAELRAGAEPARPQEGSRRAEEGDGGPNRHTSLPEEVRFGVIFWRENDHWKVTTYDERLSIKYDEKHGTDPAEWANWILVKMRPDLEVEPVPSKTEGGATPDIEITIHDVRHSETIRFKTLAAEVGFEVSGLKAETLAEARTPVWILVQTADLTSQAVTLVAAARVELEPDVFTYKEKLEFSIPDVGRYELHSLIVILPPIWGMALHKGPIFRVVP